MAHVHKQLGQTRPSVTTAASAYSPSSVETTMKTVCVCNTSAGTAKFSIYHDDDGTTYDETTALFFQADIAAKTTMWLEVFIAMDDDNGNVAVQTDTANALTFTLYGAEVA